jgi:hypothetical protein
MEPVESLKPLRPLVGIWDTVLRWSEGTHRLVGGPVEVPGVARFEWLEGGSFLHYEFGPSHWVIGKDDSTSEFTVLYGDDRGVSRVYRMTFARGAWKIWRSAPGFHQRFVGRLASDGRSIQAHWERSTDGKDWVYDFDLRFTKRPSRRPRGKR